MPFNGVGVFTQLYNWVTDKVNNVLVTASRFQTTYDDMASALTNCVTRDGQSPALGDIPMGGFKITGLADGAASTDAATVGQISSGNVYVARAYRGTTNQSIPSGIATKVQFNAAEIDSFGEWDTTVNFRWTPSVTGLFRVTLNLFFNTSSVTPVLTQVTIRAAGNIVATWSEYVGVNSVTAPITYTLNAPGLGYYVEAFVSISGAAGFVVLGQTATYLEVARIGDAM